MSRIIWLASYPKSGNTWFRAFYANFMRDGAEAVSINDINTGFIASARLPLDAALGYDSANLNLEELEYIRREWYLWLAKTAGSATLYKVHDAYTYLPNGLPQFPPEASSAVIYIVRNPLDVCVSYAHHSGRTNCAGILKAMCRPTFTVCGRRDRLYDQLRQKMLSWSEHVKSWLEAPGQRVHLMRFEDMKRDPEATFTAAVRFLGLPADVKCIRKALRFSRFEELQRQEKKFGFRERLHSERSFFRKGQVGSWKNELSVRQVEQLISAHGEVMERLGYLDSAKELHC